MTGIPELDAGIGEVRAELRRLQHALERAESFSVDGLLQRVAALAAMADAARPDVPVDGRPLLALLAEIQAFEDGVQAARRETLAELDGMGARRRATTAYGRSDG